MAQQYINTNQVCIWVTEFELVEQSPSNFILKLDGVAMDGGNGFGDETTREYSGDFLLINSQTSIMMSKSISLAHFSGQGSKWVMRNNCNLPTSSFLITSNLKAFLLFDGWIEIEAEDHVIDYEYMDFLYPVQSQDWFGIITVGDQRKLRLVSFSDNAQVEICIGDDLYCPEYDDHLGKIKLIVQEKE
jgi:hypothetical protein